MYSASMLPAIYQRSDHFSCKVCEQRFLENRGEQVLQLAASMTSDVPESISLSGCCLVHMSGNQYTLIVNPATYESNTPFVILAEVAERPGLRS